MVSSAYKAMAHPARRRILAILRTGAKTSGDLAAAFDESWPTISRHLSVLREADLITAERNGTTITYRINATVVQDFVAHMMDLLSTETQRVEQKE